MVTKVNLCSHVNEKRILQSYFEKEKVAVSAQHMPQVDKSQEVYA